MLTSCLSRDRGASLPQQWVGVEEMLVYMKLVGGLPGSLVVGAGVVEVLAWRTCSAGCLRDWPHGCSASAEVVEGCRG